MPVSPVSNVLRVSLACSLFVLVSQSDANDEVFSLDTVVVTATKNKQKQGEVAGSVAVIKQEAIQRNMPSSVDDLFKYTPSVSLSGNGRGNSPINIRGITGNRVLVNVDGVKQPKTVSYGFLTSNRHAIDPNTLKQVEVITSPASALYGSDALGGVVSYTTKEPSDIYQGEDNGIGGSTALRYNSANKGFTESVGVAGRHNQVESMLMVTHQQGHETKNKGLQGGTGAARELADPQDTRDVNVLGKVKLKLSDQQHLKVTAEHNKTHEQTQALSNSMANMRYDDRKQRDRVSADYESSRATTAFDKIKIKADWQKSKTDQLATYMTAGSYDSDYTEKDKNLVIDFEKKFTGVNAAHHIYYGLSMNSTDYAQLRNSSSTGVARGMPKTTSRASALYVQDEIKIGAAKRLSVTPGVRYDHYKLEPNIDADFLKVNPADTAPQTNKKQHTSAKLGLTYDLTKEHALFGQFSQGFKTPDMNQLYESFNRPGAYKNQANPNLKPESVDSFELGYRFKGKKANIEVAAFHNKYNDFIEQVNLGTQSSYPMGVFQYQNLQNVKIRGLEVKNSVNLSERMQLRSGIAYTKGESRKNGKTEPLNSIAPVHGVIGLAYDAPAKHWGTELTVTAAAGKRKSETDSNSNPLLAAGYGVVDITAYRQLSKKVRLDAGVFNVGDKQYWEWETARNLSPTNHSRSEAARHAKVGLTWNF